MTDDPITKEELKLLLEVQAKSTEQMVVIAQRLQSITECQERILSIQDRVVGRLYNGMGKEIVEACNTKLNTKCQDIKSESDKREKILRNIKSDTFWIKIIFGAIAFITAIVIAITQVTYWIAHGLG